ncbi:hypothetical protein GCM10010206_32610 [Streptomyces cinerochromogenes]|nr:hypothetical protein GCM10010206_32610 [Streptomyces cinerochromogenes]
MVTLEATVTLEPTGATAARGAVAAATALPDPGGVRLHPAVFVSTLGRFGADPEVEKAAVLVPGISTLHSTPAPIRRSRCRA